jgi:hypothetical protein
VDSHPQTETDAPQSAQSSGRRQLAALTGAAVLFFSAGHLYGYVRALVAAAMFGLILAWGLRKLQKISNSPPEPELTDVKEYGLRYVCSVCGLELKVEVAARDKAPTHCGEAMVLTREDGRPPLRPV